MESFKFCFHQGINRLKLPPEQIWANFSPLFEKESIFANWEKGWKMVFTHFLKVQTGGAEILLLALDSEDSIVFSFLNLKLIRINFFSLLV